MNHSGDTNKMVSDTPRTTDRVVFIDGNPWVNAPFARGLERELNAANQRIKHLRDGIAKHNQTIEQACGKVLGYPWFKDDQKNFPGSTEKDGVCVGDHVAETIVSELAKRHTEVLARIKRLEEAGDAMDKTAEPFVLDTIDEDTPMSKVGEQYEIIYDSPPTAGDHVAMNRARKEWRKAKEAKP